MDPPDLLPRVADLASAIDQLETALSPLITSPLATSTANLPLLDRAKTHVLGVYALESLLFSYLRLHGVDAKTHPVFAELNRTRAYFEKIKKAEEGGSGSGGDLAGAQKRQGVDKEAAKRFIAHALSGNGSASDEANDRKRKFTDDEDDDAENKETAAPTAEKSKSKKKRHSDKGDGSERKKKKKSTKAPKGPSEAFQSLVGKK